MTIVAVPACLQFLFKFFWTYAYYVNNVFACVQIECFAISYVWRKKKNCEAVDFGKDGKSGILTSMSRFATDIISENK